MYKLTKDPNTVARISDGAAITKGHALWEKYLVWLGKSNVPEPAEDEDDIIARKSNETEIIADQKIIAAIPGSNSSNKDRKMRKALSRAVKGDSTELDDMDAIQDAADSIIDAIENDSSYDHENSNLWPAA